ncbi:MAG: TetR/AcrR family transcriptional regulator [Acidimicrobiia bacterium]
MMQKASLDSKKRGRPPKFDQDQVISAAIGAFFHKGYEATTLSDLEEATGVDRSTLYNSFGGKAGVYAAATGAYLAAAESSLFEPLLVGTENGYADILRFLGKLRTGLTSADAIPGCLIVNDMAAGADPEAAKRYRAMLEKGLELALARTGDVDEARRADRAGLLSASVLGVNLVSKITGDSDEIARLIDAMTDEVRRWQNESHIASQLGGHLDRLNV